ncbi:hypothetical protein [Luteolibacter soli]|uniref:Uncharacterized protein n=1 Tax=Luteolibacter soli TaxID=3135280 RepID=A0ABU9ARC5_9BACT
MLLQTGDIKAAWKASLRDSELLTYPTFDYAIGRATEVSRLLTCAPLRSVAEGYQKGATITLDLRGFLNHLQHAKQLLEENIQLLQWDYFASFPAVGREQFTRDGGRIGPRLARIDCRPHGHAILTEVHIREDGRGQNCGFRDLRLCETVVTDDKGPIKLHRRRATTGILDQLSKLQSLLEGRSDKELQLIPNPEESQAAGAVKIA